MAMCDLYPDAPVATLFYDKGQFADRLGDREVITSPYSRFFARQSLFRAFLPLLPRAAEQLSVGGHQLVLSSSSAFAHGVRPSPDAVHVCYCYTPFRYAWYEEERGVAGVPAPLRPLVKQSLGRIRAWDQRAAARPGTHYVAISKLSRERIARYWNRDAPVVYPPVELDRFSPSDPEDFFLVVGELVRHKNVEVALEAARIARAPIKVVGGGPDEARLKAQYRGHAEFLGRIDDAQLASLYARARALVMPNIEEFGITAVEAQASGRPVIAAEGGGARETVVEGETGVFVPRGDADALALAMHDPLIGEMKAEAAIASARRFSVKAFKEGILEQVAAAESVS